jgi:probable rRNA maturation factor
MQIDFIDATNEVDKKYIDLIEQLLQFTANQHEIPENAEISVNFVGNDEIQQTNRTYRGKDAPTDVISFALEEKTEGEIEIIGEDLPLALGDIIVSVDQAKVQAETFHHSYKRELAFLTVHGFLHLLGYDHMSEEEEKEMFQLQEEILGEFGIER